MENLKIKETKITWERNKERFNSKVVYKNEAYNHGDVITIHTTMYVDGKSVNYSESHLPLELIDKIKELKEV